MNSCAPRCRIDRGRITGEVTVERRRSRDELLLVDADRVLRVLEDAVRRHAEYRRVVRCVICLDDLDHAVWGRAHRGLAAQREQQHVIDLVVLADPRERLAIAEIDKSRDIATGPADAERLRVVFTRVDEVALRVVAGRACDLAGVRVRWLVRWRQRARISRIEEQPLAEPRHRFARGVRARDRFEMIEPERLEVRPLVLGERVIDPLLRPATGNQHQTHHQPTHPTPN
jgi:hypothetical protein